MLSIFFSQDFGLYQDVVNGAAISVTGSKTEGGGHARRLVSRMEYTIHAVTPRLTRHSF